MAEYTQEELAAKVLEFLAPEGKKSEKQRNRYCFRCIQKRN